MTLSPPRGASEHNRHKKRLKLHPRTAWSVVDWYPSLPAISRTLSLSFQSSFHLSLMVLIRYRSSASIQLWMSITTRLVLQSRATRLSKGVPDSGGVSDQIRGCYPLWPAVSTTSSTRPTAENTFVWHNSAIETTADYRHELLPASLAVTEGILVSFFSSA